MDSPQFLNILAAETEHLITVSITIPHDAKASFERKLNEAFTSDSFSDAARAWNEERSRVVQDVLDQHLIPAGVKWAREYVREEAEDFLAGRCGLQLRKAGIYYFTSGYVFTSPQRIDVAPYMRSGMKMGDTASVLAISWGKGDPHKDAITLVFVDEAGRMREHTKIDNLYDTEMVDEFVDLIKRRRPSVIVIGGFSVATLKLTHLVKKIIDGPNTQQEGPNGWGNPDPTHGPFDIPVTYVHDDVARMYQHSKRAEAEFSALSPTAKYCVGLARYIQSPLNEFAALGADITAIAFEEEDQHLVS